MRDLDKALADITAIRSQMARGAEFRGYGPATVAATAALAVAAAVIQAMWLPAPLADAFAYAMLWGATAVVCVALIGIEMVARTRRTPGWWKAHSTSAAAAAVASPRPRSAGTTP